MSTQKIKALKEFIPIRARLRESGLKLVFTNGCFDLLHVGHVRYLNQARRLGDALAVGINGDVSVREIKGPQRPIVPAAERAEILAALSCVDFVMIFEEPTPGQLIDSVLPDVLVKGADWSLDAIVGSDAVERAGGIVSNIPVVEGVSTTGIIRKILENCPRT